MPQISILVVDDEKEIADLVEIYLVSDGYRVFKADNAKDGLEILEKEEVHLVLLDIMMPGWTAWRCASGSGRRTISRSSCSAPGPPIWIRS